jgi:hypothetical protein
MGRYWDLHLYFNLWRAERDIQPFEARGTPEGQRNSSPIPMNGERGAELAINKRVEAIPSTTKE